ncbi:hypothetical protein VPH35_099794 [Triticum aestivum]
MREFNGLMDGHNVDDIIILGILRTSLQGYHVQTFLCFRSRCICSSRSNQRTSSVVDSWNLSTCTSLGHKFKNQMQGEQFIFHLQAVVSQPREVPFFIQIEALYVSLSSLLNS